jgi:uncharacterized protein YndB with AHSA1/START domain
VIEVSAERVIERPVEEVFEFMARLEELPSWLAGCRRAWSVHGDPRVAGSRVAHEDEFMGTRFETQFDVIEWVDNERMVFEAISGPMRGRSVETFEPDGDDATIVRIHVTGELSGPLKAANWIARRAAQTQLDESLDNLKDLLEARG